MQLMIVNHVLLAILWILYSLLHSALASEAWKRAMERAMKRRFILYRIFYVLFAFVSLAGIIWFQVSIATPRLLPHFFLIRVLGWAVVVFGFTTMMICVRKYFNSLSGLKSLFAGRPTYQLMVTGIHQYVRHPLYLGTFIFIWGLFLVYPFLSLFIADIIITIYTLIGIELEERKLVVQYGEAYLRYRKSVPRIIPNILTGRSH